MAKLLQFGTHGLCFLVFFIKDALEIPLSTVQKLVSKGIERDEDYRMKVTAGHVATQRAPLWEVHQHSIRTRVYVMYAAGVLCNIDRLELIMPRYALKGGDVILKCDHSVRLEHLHKVEWKKGDDKLFMYVKGRTPPFKTWEIPGARLNTKNSSEKQIHLTNLTYAAGGSYYCVVSMETPSIFTKDSDIKDLTIIDPQDDDPRITFKKDTYYIGEMLQANCTTSPSKPPPHITWLINDEKVRDSLTKSFSNGLVHGHGYFETRAASIKQVSIEVSQLHGGEDGKLRLTCMATIPGYVNNESDYADIRNATVFIEIMEETPALPSPVEAASSSCVVESYIILITSIFLVVRLP